MNSLLLKLQESGIDIDTTLGRFLGDEELYVECLTEYLEDKGFGELKSAIEEKRYDEAFILSHMLKGVAGNLGLSSLYYSLCALVEALSIGEHDDVEFLYTNISEEYKSLKALIE